MTFLSDVQINPDGALDVTETIRVRAEQNRINHGIFRDFPTRYRGPHGQQVRVGFTFQGATLDGVPAEAVAEPYGNGVRIKIGNADTTVAIGEHVYAIRYRTTRQLGYFSNYDELYWNATGTGWAFAIDEAEARIRLPSPARFGQRAVYTGAQGSTAGYAEVVDEKPGEITVRTTQPLQAYEGLTVAVAFPKDIVAPPSGGSRLADWFAKVGPPLVGLAGLIGLCAFYFVAWKRAGRDPRPGTVVPLFTPPDDLTPAAMRYVREMDADNRTFAAALVDMGVRGHIRLVENDGGWLSKSKTEIFRLRADTELPPEEKMALDCLCMPGESVMMEQQNHGSFSSAKNGLEECLKKKYEGKLFQRNYGWAIAGVLLFAAALWLTCAAVAVAMFDAALWQVGTVFGVLLVTAMLWMAFHDSAVGKCLLTAPAFVAAAIAFALGFPIFAQAFGSGWWTPMLLLVPGLLLALSAFWWISAPTREGRSVLDHIAGFKQYLSITERERLDRMTSPHDTPELFEKYLPYAIALGVENRWAARFESVLAAAAAQGRQGFGWYAGPSDPWNNPSRFADSVGSSLSDTISSASTAPGSSSGSGGGGSSGGGGGGGGGGGW